MAKITVDISSLEQLERRLSDVGEKSFLRLAERGTQHLHDEVPYKTGNLRQGISTMPGEGFRRGVDQTKVSNISGKRTATITVSARRARKGPRAATLHLKSGKTRRITLRSLESYNYARVVAQGYSKAITPKKAKALIIPVTKKPDDESYIESEGQYFVVRRSTGGIKANPFDKRAAAKLQGEAVTITSAVVREEFGG